MSLHGDHEHGAAWEAPSEPSSDALAARAAHAANAGHVRAPRRSTGTDESQEREVGTSSTTRPRSGASHPPGGRH